MRRIADRASLQSILRADMTTPIDGTGERRIVVGVGGAAVELAVEERGNRGAHEPAT